MDSHVILLAVVCSALVAICTVGYSVYKYNNYSNYINWSRIFYTLQGACISLPLIAYSVPMNTAAYSAMITGGAIATLSYPVYNILKLIRTRNDPPVSPPDGSMISTSTSAHVNGLVIGIIVATIARHMILSEQHPKPKNKVIDIMQFIILIGGLLTSSIVIFTTILTHTA